MSDNAQVPAYCVNCKFIRAQPGGGQPLCGNPDGSPGVDVVSGQDLTITCQAQRAAGGDCGPDGTLFEATDQAQQRANDQAAAALARALVGQ